MCGGVCKSVCVVCKSHSLLLKETNVCISVCVCLCVCVCVCVCVVCESLSLSPTKGISSTKTRSTVCGLSLGHD